MTDVLDDLVVLKPRGAATIPGAGVDPVDFRRGPRAIVQARRRAMILAAARSLFDECGTRSVTIRSLTARSGTTAPTIYKLIGGRDEVLEQALLESLSNCIAHAPTVAAEHDINVIMGYAETLWQSTRLQPSYSRHQIQLNCREPGGRRIASIFRDRSVVALTGWVRALCAPERLAGVATPVEIATAIEAHIRMAVIDWTDFGGGLPKLRRAMATGVATILSGVVDDDERRRNAAWVASLADSRLN